MFALVCPPRQRRLRRSGVAARCLLALLLAASAAGAKPDQAEGLTATPLAARSGPRGATLFTEIAPAVSGLKADNAYADPRMWSTRYHEFSVGAIGTGVAIADYDGDGRPDIFVVSKVESGRLFRNLGGFRFEDVTAKAGVTDDSGEWKQGAAFADVNNDGRPDLYVCRFAAPNHLFINQGDGTFREEAAARGLALNDASSMAAFCDYDRDGWLDVYLQTNLLDVAAQPNGQRDRLFRNEGDGRFTDVSERAGIRGATQGHSATWWDFDGDNWPDLYAANDFAAPDSLYRNNGDGTFTDVSRAVVPHTPFSSMGADQGDIDNDGRIDLFVADMATTTRAKDLRGMADSRVRLKEPADSDPGAPQHSRNVLFLNTGTGRCLEVAQLAGLGGTDWTWAPRFEDLDNDGRGDLHITNGMNREQTNADLLDRIMVAENPAERVRLMRNGPVLAEENLAFRNLGDIRFENVSAAWGLNQKGVSFGSAFADLDGDGDLDLVFVNYQGPPTLLRNDGDSGHSLVVALRGTRSNRFGVGAVVRLETAAGPQVRQLVLARGYGSTSEPVLHFGLGAETAVRRLTVTWPSGGVQEFAGLAADQRLTITEADAATPTAPANMPSPQFTEVSARIGLAVAVEEAKGDATLAQPLLPFRFNRRGPALAASDLDGDGRAELVLGGTTRSPLRLLRARHDGMFAAIPLARPAAAIPINDGPVLVFDADGDDCEDILVAKGGAALPEGASSYRPELLRGDGQGGFAAAPAEAAPALPVAAGAMAAADFDRDGRLDVFIGGRLAPGSYPLPARSGLFLNRGGRFEDVTDSHAPGLRMVGLVTSALWSDVDGDGWLDLLLALEWGTIRYWHNRQGAGFEDWSERAGFASAGAGWWTALATADCNGDGRPDFVAGNLGLNTPYTASAAEPALLFAGDFKGGGGGRQLVEAAHEGGVLRPVRTRKELGAKIPPILKRFSKTDPFAAAPLEEILGAESLAAATRFAATEFRSGVFLSRADGTYEFRPLPRLAQVAPIQGLVATDLDGDGCADLACVQNSYAPIPYTGRFDGGLGLWLRGDGRGGFVPLPPLESGLVVPGDAKALVVAEVGGDETPDLVVSRNNSTVLCFLNQRGPGLNPLTVVLRAGAGNRAAVGARATLELVDGSRQTAEVALGSGYFSQSAPELHFGYRDGNGPKMLTVRWPGGRSTEHAVPAGVARWVVRAE